MKWATAISERVDTAAAVDEVTATVEQRLGTRPDLVFLFASHHHAPAFDTLPMLVSGRLEPQCLVGCSGAGIIGDGREIEGRESLSVVAASMPSVALHPLSLDPERFDEAADVLEGLDADEASPPHFVLLADPLSAPVEELLPLLDEAFPTSVKLGGLASAGADPDQIRLFLGDGCQEEGLVGVALQGAVEVEPVVAQGCRPVGEPMIITRCRDSIIHELNVGRPVDAVQRLFAGLDPRDQELFRHSLFLGIEMTDGSRFEQGDFLIRDLAGIDPESGAIAVGGGCKDYQVVQFHLRDARTSAQDLERRLAAARPFDGDPGECGALLFSCVGRGESLYGKPNHDSDLFLRHQGAVPLGGFFCNGEIGPVGDRTFLHGYTSSFGIFRPK